MLIWSSATDIYLALEPVDFRKSHDGLYAIVRYSFRQDPVSGAVFVFFNRRRDRVKILAWDKNGFWLHYKRLERGLFQHWVPKGASSQHVQIDRARLTMLLEGIDMRNVKYRRYFKRPVRIDGNRDGQANQRQGTD